MNLEITEKQVLEALGRVIDPELKKDVVSLGFIKNLKIDGASVSFDLELTSPNCPIKNKLKSQAEEAVMGVEGVEKVEIDLTARKKDHTESCSAGGQEKQHDPWADRAPIPGVKKVVAVASGKGGVGKSTIAVNLALALAKKGQAVGLLDADIYGPSVAMMMGVEPGTQLHALGDKIVPIERHGVKMISVAFMMQERNTAVIWRGPMVANLVKQLVRQVLWGKLDTIVVDLPPGTGDAQLTLIQTVPIDGAIIVTTPQQIAALDASRGIEMFRKLNVPVVGLVENMSSFVCPDCGAVHNVFPRGGVEDVESRYDTPVIARVPIDPEVGSHGDLGTPTVAAKPDSPAAQALMEAADALIAALQD